jgi:hypothetical protein
MTRTIVISQLRQSSPRVRRHRRFPTGLGCLAGTQRMMFLLTPMMNYLFLSITYITFSVVELTIFTLVAGITALLSLFDDISSVLFELASDSSGVPPRSSFPTEKCAVLILGAQEGTSITPSIESNIDVHPRGRCGKKRRASVLRVRLYRLCVVSQSTR